MKTVLNKTQYHPTVAKVIENVQLGDDIFKIRLKNPELSNSAKAGQFVDIFCEGLVLRRPFSIAFTCDDWFEIIYKVKGQGTRFLKALETGNEIDLIGPLGNGFDITDHKSLLIGAGVGVAPMIFLSEFLNQKNIEHTVLCGFKNSVDIDHLKKPNFYTATEDGKSLLSGSVVDHIEHFIKQHKIEKIYTCGPNIVMQKAVEAAKKFDLPIETALEREFACGIGVCMGCTIEVVIDGQKTNRQICKHGPVFDGRTILWQ